MHPEAFTRRRYRSRAAGLDIKLADSEPGRSFEIERDGVSNIEVPAMGHFLAMWQAGGASGRCFWAVPLDRLSVALGGCWIEGLSVRGTKGPGYTLPDRERVLLSHLLPGPGERNWTCATRLKTDTGPTYRSKQCVKRSNRRSMVRHLQPASVLRKPSDLERSTNTNHPSVQHDCPQAKGVVVAPVLRPAAVAGCDRRGQFLDGCRWDG